MNGKVREKSNFQCKWGSWNLESLVRVFVNVGEKRTYSRFVLTKCLKTVIDWYLLSSIFTPK